MTRASRTHEVGAQQRHGTGHGPGDAHRHIAVAAPHRRIRHPHRSPGGRGRRRCSHHRTGHLPGESGSAPRGDPARTRRVRRIRADRTGRRRTADHPRRRRRLGPPCGGPGLDGPRPAGRGRRTGDRGPADRHSFRRRDRGSRRGPADRAPLHGRQPRRGRHRRTRRRGRSVRGVRGRLRRAVRCVGARRRASSAGALPDPPRVGRGPERHRRGQRPGGLRLRGVRDQGQRDTGHRPRGRPPHRLHGAPHFGGRRDARHRRRTDARRLRHPRHPGERGGSALPFGAHADPLHSAPLRPQRPLGLGSRDPCRRQPVRDPRQYGRLPRGLGERRGDRDTGLLPGPRRAGRHLRARPGLARRCRRQRSLPGPQHRGLGERRGDRAARRLPHPRGVHRRVVPRPRQRRHPQQLHHRHGTDRGDRHQGRRPDDRTLHRHRPRRGRFLRLRRGPRHVPQLSGHRQRRLRLPCDGWLPYDADALPDRAVRTRWVRVRRAARRARRRSGHRPRRGGLHQRRERVALPAPRRPPS